MLSGIEIFKFFVSDHLKTTDNGVGKRSQAGLSLLEDIDSSARGFCAILSGDLVAHESSLSFTYGRPVESWSSLGQDVLW